MNIYRAAYASKRPSTPNTTNAPLGLAPGATVTVYNAGTLGLASLSTNVNGTIPLGNPFVADVNGFYAYYVNPVAGNVDEQLSGGGITAPYTLVNVLSLDPVIQSLQLTVANLQSALTTETAQRIATDLVLGRIGLRYPLGGSVNSGLQNASRMNAYDALIISVDGSKFPGYVMTVYVQGKTDDAGTSFQAFLRDLTADVDAGGGTVSVSTSLVTQTFTAVINPAVDQYVLQIEPGNASSFLYLEGYVEIALP